MSARRQNMRHLSALVTFSVLGMSYTAALAHTAVAERAIIATVHPAATDAALAVFREGGNAVDAAVTAALTLGVVDGENSGIGGGGRLAARLARWPATCPARWPLIS